MCLKLRKEKFNFKTSILKYLIITCLFWKLKSIYQLVGFCLLLHVGWMHMRMQAQAHARLQVYAVARDWCVMSPYFRHSEPETWPSGETGGPAHRDGAAVGHSRAQLWYTSAGNSNSSPWACAKALNPKTASLINNPFIYPRETILCYEQHGKFYEDVLNISLFISKHTHTV